VRKSFGNRAVVGSYFASLQTASTGLLFAFLRRKAQVPDNSPTSSLSSTRWLIELGICLTAAGVLSYFQLERHSLLVSTSDFEFYFLEYAFLPTLLLGMATTLIGSVLWACRAPVREVALYGFGIVVLAPLSLAPIPINVHGWTAAFLFVGFGAMLIGGLLLIFAAVRTVNKHRRGATSG
jgi:hypothetical protein